MKYFLKLTMYAQNVNRDSKFLRNAQNIFNFIFMEEKLKFLEEVYFDEFNLFPIHQICHDLL